jgi:hypothetical protein
MFRKKEISLIYTNYFVAVSEIYLYTILIDGVKIF